jgi:hypothetical protein
VWLWVLGSFWYLRFPVFCPTNWTPWACLNFIWRRKW